VRLVFGLVCAVLASFTNSAHAQDPAERFTFEIEWRAIHAGTAVLELKEHEARVKLESAGLVSALFKVNDTYSVRYEPPYCATSSLLDAQEGKRRRETAITFDRVQNRTVFVLRDVLKNTILRTESVEIPNCVHDIVGAIQALRATSIEPGHSIQLPVSDGRRSAQVKIDAQEREEISTSAGKFKTVRYEANLFNGVIYMRKGRAYIWLTDDAKKRPVQMKLRMSFPLGTVTLQIEKEDDP
jgi:hypothetical protein